MALNTMGGPRWNSPKGFSSPINIDPTVKEYYKQPLFYVMGHFSKFITPQSMRIAFTQQTKDDNLWVTAFKRPDSAIVVVAANLNTFDIELTISQMSANLVHVLPANSIQTYIWWQ